MLRNIRYIIVIYLLVCSYFAQSQGQPTALPTVFGGKIYEYKNYLQVDTALLNGLADTNFVPKQAGMQLFRVADGILYISTGSFTGLKWKGVGSGGGTGVYNAGNGLTLSGGIFKLDTSIGATKNYALSLYDILNATKKNKSDSALNSASYLSRGKGQNLIDSLAALTQKTITPSWGWLLSSNVGKVDSSVVASKGYSLNLYNILNATKVNISDTANMLLNYKKKTYVTVSVLDADYTVQALDDVIFLDTATTTRVLLLPSPHSSSGRQLIVTFTGTCCKWTLTDSVIDITGNDINFISYNQSLTLVSNGIYWVAVNNSNDISGLWSRTGNVISPVGVTDSLSGLLNINYGGEMGGWITVNTGVATTFAVNGNYRFIEFPAASINTGLVLSSTTQGQLFYIRNSTSGSITISPSYIDLASNASTGTIAANSSVTLIYDGVNYKQF